MRLVTAHLRALCIDAIDPLRPAQFWAGLLDWEIVDDPGDRISLLPSDPADQESTVARALRLGASHLDVGQLPEEGHVVLADPEGNEFCVIEPGNSFLAGCGFLGELSCDGTQEVGYFWSEALGWPLVWDQDQETAIQSPGGGTKIAWGGPPVRPKTRRNRMHLDLAPSLDGGQQEEVDRLVSLGATRIDLAPCDPGVVVLADPDGNEFCVVPAP